MNKIMIIGRLVRDPETQTTGSGIKYTRFTVAVDRQFGEDQSDFIPIVAWRNQADFIEKYIDKGSMISIEGRFTSSTYENNDGDNVTKYEVTADRVQSLETKAQAAARRGGESKGKSQTFGGGAATPAAQPAIPVVHSTAAPSTPATEGTVPWELDL